MKMKKISLYLLLATGISVAPSCKKDAVAPTTPITPTTVYNDEQNKENLQNTGLSMMKEMDDAKNLVGIDYTQHFADLVEKADPFGSNAAFMPLKVLTSLSVFGETGSTKALESSLKRGGSEENLNDIYSKRVGEYKWNGKNWIKNTAVKDKIILRFPSSNTKTVNNASYEISFVNYTGSGLPDDLKGNVPSRVDAKFIVDGKTLVQFEFKGVYNTDAIPSLLDAKLSVFPYSFSSTFTNNSSNISKVFAFKRNDKTLLAMGANIKGNLDKATIENMVNDENAEEINKVVKSISAYTQIFDIIIKGEANVDGIVNDLKGKDEVSEDEQAATANKNLKVGVYYVSSGQQIANSEFYLKNHTYQDYQYNNNTKQWELVEITDKDLDIRMVFKDGTKADLETYFNNGFDKLGDEFEKFAQDLENRYDN
jgi:hypothetical protein